MLVAVNKSYSKPRATQTTLKDRAGQQSRRQEKQKAEEKQVTQQTKNDSATSWESFVKEVVNAKKASVGVAIFKNIASGYFGYPPSHGRRLQAWPK